MEKRGLNCAEAIRYLGVKRKTFELMFRPRLNALRAGTSILFDKRELDALFDKLKEGAEFDADGRPSPRKGGNAWAVKPPASDGTPIESSGKSTSSIEVSAFDSVLARIKKRKRG